MCLFSKEPAPRIAQEDIECFKILREKDGQWLTPYRDYPVEFNIELTAEGDDEFSGLDIFGFYKVDKGYFHSCTSVEVTRNYAQEIKVAYTRRGRKCSPLTGFKAIIPKGSRYYIGSRGDLCSDKLIILKE